MTIVKIKSLGSVSFLLDFSNISVACDIDRLIELGEKFSPVSCDVVVSTNKKFYGKIEELQTFVAKKIKANNVEVFYIASHGEYAFGDVLVRRLIGSDFYVFDQGNLRIVYMGSVKEGFKEKELKDLADVDVLIAPVGFDKADDVMKVVHLVDPAIFVPSAYKEISTDTSLISIQDFIKASGLANVDTGKVLKLQAGITEANRILKMFVFEK